MGFVYFGRDFPNRPLDGGDLIEDIAAITVILDHFSYPLHLPDDPGATIQEVVFLRFLAGFVFFLAAIHAANIYPLGVCVKGDALL